MNIDAKEVFSSLKTSITKKLIIVVFSMYIGLTILITLSQMIIEYRSALSQSQEELANFARISSKNIAESLWSFDKDQTQNILDLIVDTKALVGAKLVNKSGKEWHAGILETESGEMLKTNSNNKFNRIIDDSYDKLIPYEFTIKYNVPSQNKEISLGHATFYTSHSLVFDKLKLSFSMTAINSIIKTIALWFFFLIAGFIYITKPLQLLEFAMREVNHGKYHNAYITNIEKRYAKSEIGKLLKCYNIMVDKVRDTQESLISEKNSVEELVIKKDLIFKNASVGIIDIDNYGTIKDINIKACELLLGKEDMLIGGGIFEIISHHGINKFNTWVETHFHNLAPSVQKIQMRKINNSIFTAECSCTSYEKQDGSNKTVKKSE